MKKCGASNGNTNAVQSWLEMNGTDFWVSCHCTLANQQFRTLEGTGRRIEPPASWTKSTNKCRTSKSKSTGVMGPLWETPAHLPPEGKRHSPLTVCFLVKWPKTKCKVTFDTCFWHSFLCSYTRSLAFALHGSFLNHFLIGQNSSTANQNLWNKRLLELPWRLPCKRA